MSLVNLTMIAERTTLDQEQMDSFRREIERLVGAVRSEVRAEGGAKGAIADIGTIAVAVMSLPAVSALIGLFKSWFERDASLEIEVEGPKGKVRIKSADAQRLSSVDLAALVTSIMEK
jgi:hypothetical protein